MWRLISLGEGDLFTSLAYFKWSLFVHVSVFLQNEFQKKMCRASFSLVHRPEDGR